MRGRVLFLGLSFLHGGEGKRMSESCAVGGLSLPSPREREQQELLECQQGALLGRREERGSMVQVERTGGTGTARIDPGKMAGGSRSTRALGKRQRRGRAAWCFSLPVATLH